MAERDTHQHTTDAKEGETQLTNMDHASASNENKQEGTDIALNVKFSEASSSACTDRETNSENCEDLEQVGSKNGDSSEEKMVPLKEASSSPNEASPLNVVDNNTLPQADDRSHGDHSSVTAKDEPPTTIEYHPGENKATKSSAAALDDRRNDQLDGPRARNNEETTDINNYGSEAAEDDGSCLDIQENTTSQQTVLPQKMSDQEVIDEQRNKVETIGPTTQETPEATVPVVTGRQPAGNGRYLLAVVTTTIIVAVVAILVQRLLQPEHPPQEEDARQIIFLREMEKLKTQFPNQRSELWIRSKIHLLRHLQTAQPTEPVSLILTSGVRAESTLYCLAQGLASTFSSALNASVLHIDGVSKASQDSDQVKLDIDSKLQGAFEGDKPVAVIHRFEELPPGSTLIFYRYCDHENAAFKKTFLIFTVLLEEEEIPAKSRLSTVEEMVDDQLQRKFLSDGHPVSFDRMDLDKYGGLWSRISHLILPVTTELRMKHEECKGT